MIQHIHIWNFKSLVDTQTSLGPLNVFVGNNGSGKTSFFKAIAFLRSLIAEESINVAMERSGESFNDFVSLRADTKSIDFHVRVKGSTEDDVKVDASVEIGVKKRRFTYVHMEKVVPWDFLDFDPSVSDESQLPYFIYRYVRLMLARETGSRSIEHSNSVIPHSLLRDVHQSVRHRSNAKQNDFPQLSTVARQLLGYRHFEIWGPQSLRRHAKGFSRTLTGDGSNLASTLYFLRKTERSSFDSLMHDMSQSYPWLQEIEFRRAVDHTVSLMFVEKARLSGKVRKSKKYLPSQVSDGFLRMLALNSLKYCPPSVKTIAYEEPENGLHPQMIAAAANALRAISERGVQVLVSTHSPLFLSAIFADCASNQIQNELKLVMRDTNGETTISSPDISLVDSAFSQGISIGDLWSMLLGEADLAQDSSR